MIWEESEESEEARLHQLEATIVRLLVCVHNDAVELRRRLVVATPHHSPSDSPPSPIPTAEEERQLYLHHPRNSELPKKKHPPAG